MSRAVRVTSTIAVLALGAALVLPLAAIAGGRFDGYVAGVGNGEGHSFIIGNGLNLVFIDHERSRTRYRVCWTRGSVRKCWSRSTGAVGKASKVFTAAPTHVGRYTTTWYVRGRAVARWSFSNGPGDYQVTQPPAVGRAARSCGSFRVRGIRTRVRVRVKHGRVSCSTAIRVMKHLFNRGPGSSPEGWHCVGPQTGYASCRKSGNKIVAYF
jgi:hypothetical protein